MDNKCTVEGCERPLSARGLCCMHYQQARNAKSLHTHPLKPKGKGYIDNSGYSVIYVEGVRKLEHVKVAEDALGKSLPRGVDVHHVDRDKLNNRPNNLVICPNRAYHKLIHQRMDALEACGHTNWRKCGICKQYDAPENLYIQKGNVYHQKCATSYRRNLSRGKFTWPQ